MKRRAKAVTDKMRLDYLGPCWAWRIHFNDYESDNLRQAVDRRMREFKNQGAAIRQQKRGGKEGK